MVALPTQLFRSTGIPVCVWFFAKDKTAGQAGLGRPHRRRCSSSTPANLGYMVDRAERALSDDDIAKIADTYHAWRGTASAPRSGLTYEDVPGFCKSATLAEIKAADYALTPGRYVGAAEAEDDGEPIEEKIERLTKELFAQFDESARLERGRARAAGRLAMTDRREVRDRATSRGRGRRLTARIDLPHGRVAMPGVPIIRVTDIGDNACSRLARSTSRSMRRREHRRQVSTQPVTSS